MILKYSLQSSYFDVFCLSSLSNNISNETRDIYLINIATMDRKDPKGNVYKYLCSLFISL